jgi:hypothetical protein
MRRLLVSALAGMALAACFAAPAAAAPDPLSDADGDGIPYQWEVPAPGAGPPKPTSPAKKRCKRSQKLRRGKCVRRCKKGRVFKRGKKGKRGKCVKRKKAKAKRKKATRARASIATASVAPLGADPNHKDVFVQVNYASASIRQSLACSELDAIVAAFANAPVSNPDGQSGIDLHIDAGVTCPSRSYALGGSYVFDAGACPGTTATLLASQLPESRVGTFHVAGFSPTCGGSSGEGGVADLHGTKMAVYTDGPSFAHVLMHELGHNLGLDHPFPGQPNRLSSMNTRLAASPTGNSFDTVEVLDYQRVAIPALDENSLTESAGISAPPAAHDFYVLHYCAGIPAWANAWPGDGAIDWNCNTPPFGTPVIDPAPVSVDVNGDGQLTVFPATHEEWSTLDYASGSQIGPR